MAWHDMGTPITVIRGQAELLLSRLSSGAGDPGASKAAAASIVRHVDRLSELLTTLFDVHCLEAGLLSLSPWPTDLSVLAREVTDGIRSSVHHEIRLVADESVVGEWDERRIRQVLMNLISNALKYSPEGSTVTVSISGGERTATVAVQDEGIGLDGTELGRLFRRGYRTESARHVAGAGLGLYFAQGIVAAHGGRMWAESKGHGLGSKFCFALPIGANHTADRPVAKTA